MTKPIPMLDLARLHAPLAAGMHDALDRLLGSSRFIGGPEVERFEAGLARACGVSQAIGVSSGTDALLVALMALGLGPGDEVIVPTYTFFATAGAVARLGATPVFVDIEPATFNIDPAAAAAAITPRTVGLIPVHLFGQMADLDPLVGLAGRHGLWLIEDAAQAIGARDGDRAAGAVGTLGVFSFFPAKNLGALGDAGAVVTADAALADRVRRLREHGAHPKYHHDLVGGNFRLDALQAAFLDLKLPQLAAWERGRRAVAARYDRGLAPLPGVVTPPVRTRAHHVYNQYVVRVEGRDRVQERLAARGVATAVYYPVPLHRQRCFATPGRTIDALPVAERAAAESLALPIDPLLAPTDQERVIATLDDALTEVSR